MASEAIVDVTPETFEQSVLSADVPVLVDFWAPWCGPCLAVGPVLEQLAGELADRVRIVKLDIDQHEELAFRYQVSSIPTFILFKDGQVAGRMLGAMPKAAFRDFLDRNL
jgi:thioredoxin 1